MLKQYNPECSVCREAQFNAVGEAIQFGKQITGVFRAGGVYAETNFDRDIPSITLQLRGVGNETARRICKWDGIIKDMADRYGFDLLDAYLDMDSYGECDLELSLRSFRESHSADGQANSMIKDVEES